MVNALIVLCHLAIAEETNLGEAKILYDNGKMLFEEERYENAIDSWQRSWEISQKPILLYNIALAYEAMEDYEQAINFIYKYRSFAEPDEHQFLKDKIVELNEKKSQQDRLLLETKEQVHSVVEEVADVGITPTTIGSDGETNITSLNPKGMYVAWGTTAAFIGTSTTFALLKNSIQHQYTSNGCTSVQENQKTVFYCPPTKYQEEDMEYLEDLINREKYLMVATNIGWGLSITSASLSSWLTIKHFSQPAEKPTSMWISNNMIGIAGEF